MIVSAFIFLRRKTNSKENFEKKFLEYKAFESFFLQAGEFFENKKNPVKGSVSDILAGCLEPKLSFSYKESLSFMQTPK